MAIADRLDERRSLGPDILAEMSPWTFITNFGDPFLTLPLASAILAWLVATSRERLAVYWFTFFCCAAALVGATKFAYAGWGLQISGLDFTVISGHTMLSSAVYPVAFYISLHGFGQHAARWAAACGFIFAAIIGISRVPTGAHSASEVLAGWLLGSVVSALLLSQFQRHGRPSRISMVFATAAIAIAVLCYGHLAPIQSWIVNTAPRLARIFTGAH